MTITSEQLVEKTKKTFFESEEVKDLEKFTKDLEKRLENIKQLNKVIDEAVKPKSNKRLDEGFVNKCAEQAEGIKKDIPNMFAMRKELSDKCNERKNSNLEICREALNARLEGYTKKILNLTPDDLKVLEDLKKALDKFKNEGPEIDKKGHELQLKSLLAANAYLIEITRFFRVYGEYKSKVSKELEILEKVAGKAKT